LDSPIILSLVYRSVYQGTSYPATLYNSEHFDKLVLDIHNQYDSINILLERSDDGVHNDKERYQSLEESKNLDREIENTLIKHNIPYHKVKVGKGVVKKIIKLI